MAIETIGMAAMAPAMPASVAPIIMAIRTPASGCNSTCRPEQDGHDKITLYPLLDGKQNQYQETKHWRLVKSHQHGKARRCKRSDIGHDVEQAADGAEGEGIVDMQNAEASDEKYCHRRRHQNLTANITAQPVLKWLY